jgi:hypothetical protein
MQRLRNKNANQEKSQGFLGRPNQSKSDFLPTNKEASIKVNGSSGKHDRDCGDSPGPGVL